MIRFAGLDRNLSFDSLRKFGWYFQRFLLMMEMGDRFVAVEFIRISLEAFGYVFGS
jgi:hypothetical protein